MTSLSIVRISKRQHKKDVTESVQKLAAGTVNLIFYASAAAKCQMSNWAMKCKLFICRRQPETKRSTKENAVLKIKQDGQGTVKNVTNQIKCNQTEWTGQQGDIRTFVLH